MSIRQRVTAAVVVGLCLAGSHAAPGAPAPGPADKEAAAEELLARPQVDFIHSVRDAEVSRLINDAAGQPSAYIEKLTRGNWSDAPRLGDVKVPLHRRLIELARLDLLAEVAAAHEAVPRGPECNVQNAFGRALYEEAGRAAALGMIYCARTGGKRAIKAMHEARMALERHIGELRLPPYTHEQWLGVARAEAATRDAALQATYRHWRQLSDALERWILFLDRHAREFRVVDGGLAFDNDEDAVEARALQEEIAKLQEAGPVAATAPAP